MGNVPPAVWKLTTVKGKQVGIKKVLGEGGQGRVFLVDYDGEDKARPLSDEALTKAMADRGFPIARRTIAKYREQMGIPVARMRKQ